MKKMWMSVGAVLALLVTSTAVKADGIPWGYTAADTTIFNSNNPIQTSSIVFKGSSGAASGNSGFIIYNLTTTSTASSSLPDSFANVPFNLSVTLTDINATGSSDPGKVVNGTFSFSGLFNADNVTKTSSVPGPVTWTSPTTAMMKLGGSDTGFSDYSVSIASFTPPGQPGGAPGAILALVNVAPEKGGGSGGPPPDAPEPTSLALAALALPALFAARRRLKKAQA
jgi:hypothetical protein